ncbi:MAG: hypothetical protein CSA42_07895, partial [Gammaproteobacteria bacterium]
YPLCTGGKRACPPEDCGGLPGYYQLVEILADKKHQEYNDMVDWLKHHAKDYTPYDPDSFDSSTVKFSNPKKRFKMAFE